MKEGRTTWRCKMDYDDFLRIIKKRRSARHFKPDQVPDEFINKIIEAAKLAPSSGNCQPWEFVVVRKAELRKQIMQFTADYMQFSRKLNNAGPSSTNAPSANVVMSETNIAPVFILLFGDSRTKQEEPQDLQSFPLTLQEIFTSSLAGANLYMHLAASTLGLASRFNGVVRLPLIQYQVRKLLGVPGVFELHDLMMLGYPDGAFIEKTYRQDKMVHFDRCSENEFRTDEEVLDFFKKSRKVLQRHPASQP
jgi:nitroreductase